MSNLGESRKRNRDKGGKGNNTRTMRGAALAQRQWKDMERMVDRLVKQDSYSYFEANTTLSVDLRAIKGEAAARGRKRGRWCVCRMVGSGWGGAARVHSATRCPPSVHGLPRRRPSPAFTSRATRLSSPLPLAAPCSPLAA